MISHAILVFATWTTGIPTFAYPDEAAATFSRIWSQTKDIEMMYQIPSFIDFEATGDIAGLKVASHRKEASTKIISGAISEARDLLTETESKKIFDLYGLESIQNVVCRTSVEASEAAAKMGFPVVMKIDSKTITHKKDVGGVQLNLRNEEDVHSAFGLIQKNVSSVYTPDHFQGVVVQKMVDLNDGIELIFGSTTDPDFGPLVLFGAGGTYVEIFKDRSLGVPPFTSIIALQLIHQTQIYKALKGGQGKRFAGVDIDKLANTLVRFSHMVVDLFPHISECDINPLLIKPDGTLVCLDGRVKLSHPGACTTSLVIRPYPAEYTYHCELRDGSSILMRPMHAADEFSLAKFHSSLSKDTVRQRYLTDVSLEARNARQSLVAVCNADYDKEISFGIFERDKRMSERKKSKTSGKVDDDLWAIFRLIRHPNRPESADIKLVVADAKQGMGIGRFALQHGIEAAKIEGIRRLHALVLAENDGMIKLLKRFDFRASPFSGQPHLLVARLDLD